MINKEKNVEDDKYIIKSYSPKNVLMNSSKNILIFKMGNKIVLNS